MSTPGAGMDATDLLKLSRDLGKVGRAGAGLMFGAFMASGQDLRATWRTNAKATAGKHGKHYPNSITAEARLSTNIQIEVGPDPRLPQGGMSFEYGSVNQPPHLDGQRAMDSVEPRLDARIADALNGIATVIETGTVKREYTTKAGNTIMATDAQIANWTRGSSV